ncbi:hypothetical protein [Nitrosophilus kaiyonis]|uniref:hypothetical protein n=1 Tax=Nitrosophilus kaiyonis TaxID=2930200 RepID=UPI0024911755|nr:hypothetical protein [Nitrosophilus kaiyonis]
MKYLVRIKKDGYSILEANVKKENFEIKFEQFFQETNEFTNYIKNKKNIYISFLPSEIISKDFPINSAIKNEKTIEKILEFNLKKEYKEDFVFNYYLSEKNEANNQNIYHIEAIKKSEILEKISSIDKKENIKIITTDYHALKAATKKTTNLNTFISVFIENNHIIYVATYEDKVLYRRESFIYIENPLLRPENIASDISRTVMFIKQQYRNIDFKNIVFAGDLKDLEGVFENLSLHGFLLSMPYAKVFSKSITVDNFLKNFINLGLLNDKDIINFEPIELKSQKQFNKFYYFVLSVIVLIGLYFGYEDFNLFTDLLKKQDIIDEKIETIKRLKQNTKILDSKDLEFYINYFQNQNLSIKSEFLNDFAIIEPILRIIKPEKIGANDAIIKVEIYKKFNRLQNLMNLNKKFKNEIEKIKQKAELIEKTELDFENLVFKSILILKRKKQ